MGFRALLVLVCACCVGGATFAQSVGGASCVECDEIEYGELRSMVAFGPSSASACRVTVDGACGSGSFVGKDANASYVMTNAHVAGTRVGRVCTLRFVEGGRVVQLPARVAFAAYSDRTLTDWALLRCDRVVDVPHVPMSKEVPKGDHYTTGSPRCVWPLQSTAVRTADVSNTTPLWRWRPNAIGGQSGSGVWSVDGANAMFGLLTWSWGGLGAGQQTAVIARQLRDRSVEAGARPEGLREMSDTRSPTEVGFFGEASIGDLPIWLDPEKPAPGIVDRDSINQRLRDLLELLTRLLELLRTLRV